MIRNIIALLLFIYGLSANIIDGIAIKVNGNIITLYEIKELQEKQKIDKNKAIEILIQEKLKENEIKRLGIKVDDNKVNEEINNIAISNNLTRNDFENAIKSQGVDFEKYKNDLKSHIINRELMQNILQTNTNLTSEDDLRKYYENNKNEFMIPTKIKVTSYTSNSDVALQRFLQNPMMLNPNIQSKDEEIDIRSLPQQIVNIFLETPEKKFTPVLNSGSTLIIFFIKEKSSKEVLPFEDIRTNVMQKYAQVKENEILNEYFNKIKANSKIEIIRE
ncbi:peptidylprolyl isomerase [Helicobacter sp. MIT 14-3879]|uniref:peptidylprolyl isomerase n=1 Tax=Helicobacter sp. MIT 14-3879 TaxID=2040649 RepID=UPI000E1E7230|nr:peptidylprolyl isomerase [Helicobacter sp. MIT 14-3879]RDU64093.1 hypothetical protein CQA44_03975 [Helicobacter sp. MIT 14-3879]